MRSPAFQFYAADYLGSQRTALMTLEEEGAYLRLLCSCWLHGSIPADPELIARLVGKGGSTTLATTLATMFQPHPTDASRLVHDRLEVERKKQAAWAEKSRAGGKKSAQMNQTARVVQPPLQPPLANGSNHLPTLQSTDYSLQTTVIIPSAGFADGVGEGEGKSVGRERNELFDALATATDGHPDKLTTHTKRAVGVALASIRRVQADLTPAEITRRAENYRHHFRDAALTASALAKHWARCEAAPAGKGARALPTDMTHEELVRRHGGTF